MIRTVLLALMLTGGAFAQASKTDVDHYSQKDIAGLTAALDKKGTPFAGDTLKRYGNHYTMMAYRTATGSSEVHEHEADVFIIESGTGALLEGGKLVNAKTEKPGELRGSSIAGGKKVPVATGDVIHIPAGVPHQLLIDKGKPIAYFVIKVTGQ